MQAHQHKGRGLRVNGRGAGKGLEFYQNSICKDPSRIDIIWSMSMAGGQAWGGGGKHQLSREGVAPREGGFARCMWPGMGGWVGRISLLLPYAFFFFFLNSPFGQTVAFQSLRNKRLPNQDINTIGACTYLCLKERDGDPSWGGGGGRKAFGSRSRLWL